MQYQEMDSQETSTDILYDILYSLQSEKYEPGGIFTIGGQAGTYQIKSPFNTECEYSVVSITSSSPVATPGTFALSASNPSLVAPTATSLNLGAVATGGEGNPLNGIVGWISSSSPLDYSAIWLPLGQGVYIYLAVAPGASNTIVASIAFRRVYVHAIPDVPRQYAHTHSMAQSRRSIRMVPGSSKQVSGFAAQYPNRERQREYFMHNPTPYNQDVENMNPLTPDTVSYRGRRGR